MTKSSAKDSFITEGADIPFWYVEISDEEAALVTDALARKRFSMGPVAAELEALVAAELDVPYAVATTSGTMALVLGLAVHDIGPGDEVLVPTRTFIATAHAVRLLGAVPVLVDCLPETTVLDVNDAARKVTSRTRAIMPVHLNGRAADMDAALELARLHGLHVIEDAAQGLFSKHRLGYLGTIGDVGCFSFSMVKLVATGQGGMIVTRNRDIWERLRRFRDHGVADVVSHAYLGAGGNFKPTDIICSIGVAQVRKRTRKVDRVNAVYRRYLKGLSGVDVVRVLPVDVDTGEVALWTEVLSDNRVAIMDYLAANGVQTRKFLPCCHSAPHFAGQGSFPRSEFFSRQGFNLPCGPDLPMEYVDRTIELLKNYKRL